jgi:hypothetical protein
MGYLSDGLQLLLNRSTLQALWGFDRDLRDARGNMQQACGVFFERADYRVEVTRPWNSSSGGILFIADHVSALDGFALALACPSHLAVRRVMFMVTGYALGRCVARNSVLVWPRGNYQNLVHDTHGFVDRVAYLMTHRWGPWVKPARALRRMCGALAKGDCLCLLPSGTVGDWNWRSGVGGVIHAAVRERLTAQRPLFLAPVYFDWRNDLRHVSITAPGLVSFEQIVATAGSGLSRRELTDWLQKRYRHHEWTFEQPKPR